MKNFKQEKSRIKEKRNVKDKSSFRGIVSGDRREPTKRGTETLNFKKNWENRSEEVKFYGFHACLNLWKSRPQDIIKVYVENKRLKEVTPLLKWCAKEAKAYHLISEEEMEKVSGSHHHEGLCILAKEVEILNFEEMMKRLILEKKPSCLLYLDGVQNPHNIGSIMRVAAHFGVKYILGEKSLLPKVSPSAYRVAQGGAEHVKLVPVQDTIASFKALEKIGFRPLASSSHGGNSLYEFKFAPKTIILMGSESDGIKPELMRLIKETVLIPGTGLVESLNVSIATGLFLGQYFSQLTQKA